MKNMVHFYDQKTRRVIKIPAAELTSESQKIQLEGVKGEVWINPVEEVSSQKQNLPSPEAFHLGRPKSMTRWMTIRSLLIGNQGFVLRRRVSPMFNHRSLFHLAELYHELVSTETSSLRRFEIFRCLMICRISDLDTILHLFRSKILSEEEIKEIAQKYFG